MVISISQSGKLSAPFKKSIFFSRLLIITLYYVDGGMLAGSCMQCSNTHYVYIYFAQVQSTDDNCGELVECMGVASGCG